ncbi:MAG: hypothetical protein VX473_01340 [Candidatus Thermoplasmatota archaeon]|nr:hypothetical protein [Candidatus Thermoplasmatota archaeon]
MATRVRTVCGLCALLLFSSLATPVVAEGAVELENPIWIAEYDLGLEALAAGGETDQKVLIAGADGYARLLDGDDPSEQIELAPPTNNTIRAIDWHPRGKTALLAGDGGTLLRYVAEDHSVTTVSGSVQLNNLDMAAVAWNAAGSNAYIGGEDGYIWAYHEGEGGQGVFQLLNGTRHNGSITGIACQPEEHLCVVTTESDGVAVIVTNSNHELIWIGAEDRYWRGVNCEEPTFNRCVAIGDGRAIGMIGLNIQLPETSTVFTKLINTIGGEFTHIHTRGASETLITMAPFQVMAWDLSAGEAYEWVEYGEVANDSGALAGERLIGSWGTTDDSNIGFLVSSYGAIIGFHPPPETSVWTDSLISYVLGIVVFIAVPGSILGLIFMNSETLQKKYYARRNAKFEAAENARIEKEKAEKRAARKAKNS